MRRESVLENSNFRGQLQATFWAGFLVQSKPFVRLRKMSSRSVSSQLQDLFNPKPKGSFLLISCSVYWVIGVLKVDLKVVRCSGPQFFADSVLH